jgi:hypothetical protein
MALGAYEILVSFQAIWYGVVQKLFMVCRLISNGLAMGAAA